MATWSLPRVLFTLLVALAFHLGFGIRRWNIWPAEVEEHSDLLCVNIASPPFSFLIHQITGVEDIALHQLTGRAFLPYSDHAGRIYGGGPRWAGGVMVYDMKTHRMSETSIKWKQSDGLEVLNPYGLSFLADSPAPGEVFPTGDGTLAVVNHLNGSSAQPVVDIFHFDTFLSKLTHKVRVQNPLIVSPNDVHMISKYEFYVTNDHWTSSRSRWLNIVEDLIRIDAGSVVFCDIRSGCRSVAVGLGWATGINASPDNKFIYIAEKLNQRLAVFSRDEETNSLNYLHPIGLDVSPNNIAVDADGELWVAGFVSPWQAEFALWKAYNDKTTLAPSVVQKIVLNKRTQALESVTEVFRSKGNDISLATVAVHYQGHLLLGPLYNSKVLDCKIKKARPK